MGLWHVQATDLNFLSFEYVADDHICIGCGICAGICPCGIRTTEPVV